MGRRPGSGMQAALLVGLALGLGLGACLLGGIGEVTYGLTPAAAAIVLTLVGRRLGWTPAVPLGLRVNPGWRPGLVAVFVPGLVLGTGAVAAVALGLGTVPASAAPGAAQAVVAWGLLVGVMTVAALGEELGWRGYMAPRLEGRPRGRVTLVMGVLWWTWHLPLILVLGSHQAPVTPVGLGLFGVQLVGMAALLNELRRVTGSVWPAALAHGAHNATLALVGVLVVSGGPDFEYVGPQAGIVPTALYGLIAIWLLARRSVPRGTEAVPADAVR